MSSENTRNTYQQIALLVFVVSIIAAQQCMKHHVAVNAFFHTIGHALAAFLTSSAFHTIMPVLVIGALFLAIIALNQYTQNKAVAKSYPITPAASSSLKVRVASEQSSLESNPSTPSPSRQEEKRPA